METFGTNITRKGSILLNCKLSHCARHFSRILQLPPPPPPPKKERVREGRGLSRAPTAAWVGCCFLFRFGLNLVKCSSFFPSSEGSSEINPELRFSCLMDGKGGSSMWIDPQMHDDTAVSWETSQAAQKRMEHKKAN